MRAQEKDKRDIKDSKSRGRKIPGWTGIFGYLLLIYFTLPYAPAIQRGLVQTWGDPAKKTGAAVTALLGAAAFLYFLVRKKKRSFRILFSGLILAALYTLAFKYMVRYPAEQFHFAEYGALSWMAFFMLIRENSLKKTIGLVLLLGPTAGFLDEIIQHFLPMRHFEWRDVLINIVSSLLGLAGVMAVAWERKRQKAGAGR